MLKHLIKEAIYILTNEHGFMAPAPQAPGTKDAYGRPIAGGTPPQPLTMETDFMSLMQPPEGGWGGAAPTMGQVDFPEMLEEPGPTPTAGWYEGLDPDVRAGIEEPFERQQEQLFEMLAGRGTMGSARAGVSGAGADVLAEHRGKAAPIMAQSAWNMMMPYEAQAMKYQTESQRAMGAFQAAMQAWSDKARLQFGGAQTRFGAMAQDYMARQQEGFRQEAEEDPFDAWRPMSEFERTWSGRTGTNVAWAR